jgi:regulatory protein
MDKCTSRALYLIGARAYTERKLREKLLKNYPTETVEKAILWLSEREFLDDKKYAENRIAYLQRVKKYGIIRIKNDLKAKGVPDEIIAETLRADKENETDYIPLIKERIVKKCRGELCENLQNPETVQKIIASMIRYGFLYKDVKKAIAELNKELT